MLNRRSVILGSAMSANPISLSSGSVAQDATPAGTPARFSAVEDLFVQLAASGTATFVDAEPGAFRLAFLHDSRQTLFFTDRPARGMGLLKTSDFVRAVTMDDDPPNAVLTIDHDADGETDALTVLELREAAFDDETGQLTYLATIIDPETQDRLWVATGPAVSQTLPAAFGSASLFIDGYDNGAIVVANLSGPNVTISVYPHTRERPHFGSIA